MHSKLFFILFIYFFFQVEGANIISTGKSSSLPAIISKMNTHFDKIENVEKPPVGPTSPRPGPILLIVAATDVKVVTRSLFSRQMIIKDVMKTQA